MQFILVILICVLVDETYFYSHFIDRLEIRKGDIRMEGGKIVGGGYKPNGGRGILDIG